MSSIPTSTLRPPQQQAVQQTQQYVSPGMTGAQDLGQYGDWQQTPDYGPAWFPQVAINWAPYRYGHWAYIAPWGWTWIDDASWGFAPFHYGRWARISIIAGAGCPGASATGRSMPRRWSASSAIFSASTSAAGRRWAGSRSAPARSGIRPIGYGQHYFRDVNYWGGGRYGNFDDARNVNVPIRNFLNRRDATLVAASAMANSQPIGRSFHDITPAEWQSKFANAAARNGEVPVKPTLRTAGLTPTAARQFGQVLAANGQLPGRPQAPGPQVAAKQPPATGITLGNGRSLPNFAAAQPNGARIQAQSHGGCNAGGASRIITLGNTDEQGNRRSQSFGGFSQQSQMLQAQNQAKPGAPGPAILPRGNAAPAVHRHGECRHRQQPQRQPALGFPAAAAEAGARRQAGGVAG